MPEILLNSVLDLHRSVILLKKGILFIYFQMNSAKCFRTTFLQSYARKLLLKIFGYVLVTLVQN